MPTTFHFIENWPSLIQVMGDRRYIVIRRGVSVTQHLFLPHTLSYRSHDCILPETCPSIVPLMTSLTQNSGQKPTVKAEGGISLVHEQANAPEELSQSQDG